MQLDQYQEEELLRIFASMKRVGQKPVVDYLLEFAQDKNQAPKRRAAALGGARRQPAARTTPRWSRS